MIETYITLEEIKRRSKKNSNGCWVWKGEKDNGYGCIVRKGKRIRVTRIVLALAGYDMSNKKLFACHKCDNESCVNPAHLFAGTSSDNQKDLWNKVRAGKTFRYKAGEPWRRKPFVKVEE
jgi:hypothetical protein